MSKEMKLLVKFGGKRLYAMVCQAVADEKMSVEDAANFLNESEESILYCVEEIKEVMGAVRNALDNKITVDHVMLRSQN
jgi:hypothetical protein